MPATRTTDPDTSREAAASVTGITDLQHWIIATLAALGPSTHYDLREQYDHKRGVFNLLPPVSDSGLRTRCSELVDAGLVQDSGMHGRLPTGRRAILWELTRAGWDEWSRR